MQTRNIIKCGNSLHTTTTIGNSHTTTVFILLCTRVHNALKESGVQTIAYHAKKRIRCSNNSATARLQRKVSDYRTVLRHVREGPFV